MTADAIRIDRPDVPDGYGVPEHADGLLAWADVEARLVASTEYWLASTRPDGRPHVVPRWGVWLDGAFHYDGSPDTRHAQNVIADPRCALHLESGWEAVIVEGRSVRPEPVDPGGLGARLSTAFGAKYGAKGYTPEPDAWSDDTAGGLRIVRPEKVLAWTSFPDDMTRFRFGG